MVTKGGLGPNIGHTFIIIDQTFKVPIRPSDAFNTNTTLAIGTSVLVIPSFVLKKFKQTISKK